MIGRTIRWIIIPLLDGMLNSFPFDRAIGFLAAALLLLLAGGVVGLPLGITQSVVWRGRAHHPEWWVWANVISSALYPVLFVFGVFLFGSIFYPDLPRLELFDALLKGIPDEQKWYFAVTFDLGVFKALVSGLFTGAI